MPTLNLGDDGHYYIRGKDFHHPYADEDEYWTWQVLELEATISVIRDAGYEVYPFPAWFPWEVESILWENGYLATKKQIREKRAAQAAFMGMLWDVPVVDLADELGVKPTIIMNEAGRRGVRVKNLSDNVPHAIAARIREYIRSNSHKGRT